MKKQYPDVLLETIIFLCVCILIKKVIERVCGIPSVLYDGYHMLWGASIAFLIVKRWSGMIYNPNPKNW
jgi:hypothetical protein